MGCCSSEAAAAPVCVGVDIVGLGISPRLMNSRCQRLIGRAAQLMKTRIVGAHGNVFVFCVTQLIKQVAPLPDTQIDISSGVQIAASHIPSPVIIGVTMENKPVLFLHIDA